MSQSNDSIGKTVIVAFSLCLVCSILVSGAAVMLKPMQVENKANDIKRNILICGGLTENPTAGAEEVNELFERITPVLVDLESGEAVEGDTSYDQYRMAKDPAESYTIESSKDLAGIKYRAKKAVIYLEKNDQGIKQVILPIHGKGLWSTLYGFLALESDMETVRGLSFYAHAETPGLGGEVDNPRWKSQWPGKKLYNANGSPAIEVIKGVVSSSTPGAEYKIDGLSGATITSVGVSNLVRYWVGNNGYGPFLKKLKMGAM